MALDKLNHLYREVILDHAQHPKNNRTLTNATYEMKLLNPSCGDVIIIQAIVENDIVTDVAFTGHGCSISLASASMMTEVLKGCRLVESLELVETFNQLIQGQTIIEKHEIALKDAYFLKGIKQFPARYKCAILSWKAFEGAITENINESEE